MDVTLRATMVLDEVQRAANGDRVLLTGSTSDVRDDIRRYEDASLDYLVLSVAASDTDSTIDAVRRFADDVLARV